MNFTVLNNRLTIWWRWSLAWKPKRKERSESMTTCQLIIPPQHLWPSGFPSPPEGSSVLPHHTGRYQRSIDLEFQTFTVIGLRCVSCNIVDLAAIWRSFQQCKCEKFQIAREKVVVTVTTTFKTGGDMSPPSHTKLRLWFTVELKMTVQMFS